MSEGKRIEGQMFLKGGMGWAVGIFLLCIAVAGTLLVGYLVNRWAPVAGSAALGLAAGGGATGAGTTGGGAWAGPMAGLPGQAVVAVDSVKWPVAAGSPFRDHWEKKIAGIGTLNQWYMDPGSPQGYQWGSSISIPVKGENSYVIVVNLPRNSDPATATGGQIWVCQLGQSSVGDVMPNETTVRVRATLDSSQVKYLWDNDFPPGLVKDLIDAANGKGPLLNARTPANSGPAYQYFSYTPIDSYFTAPGASPSSPPTDGPSDGK